LNTGKVLDKYKILPKNKAKMSIPLCKLLYMWIVRLALKINVLTMEQTFFTGYREGEKAFYVSSKKFEGEEELVSKYMPLWSTLWTHKNTEFEKFLLKDPNFSSLCGNMFHVWDGNHHFQTWRPYIDLNHLDEERIDTSLSMPLFWIYHEWPS
jgi:hypothetical protein